MIYFDLEGNWRGVGVSLAMLPSQVKSAATWGQRKASERLVKIVKKHINDQDLGWAARAPNTVSGDPRILVDQEDYYGAIKAWKDGEVYFAGVPQDKFNRRGVRIDYYANLHESGTAIMPARPLWKPSYKELGGNKGVKAIVLASIFAKVSKLRALGFDIKFEQ